MGARFSRLAEPFRFLGLFVPDKRYIGRVRGWACLGFLFAGCAVYEQDVLWRSDAAVLDMSPALADGASPCSWVELSSQSCLQPWVWWRTAVGHCCNNFQQIVNTATFANICSLPNEFGAFSIRFECCPPDKPTGCETKQIGGVCDEDRALLLRATEACATVGKMLTRNFKPLKPCGPRRFQEVSFECCPAQCKNPATF